jgi:hypothetical protein
MMKGCSISPLSLSLPLLTARYRSNVATFHLPVKGLSFSNFTYDKNIFAVVSLPLHTKYFCCHSNNITR